MNELAIRLTEQLFLFCFFERNDQHEDLTNSLDYEFNTVCDIQKLHVLSRSLQTMDGTGGGSSSSEVAAARQFTKRISDFLKPSNNLFAKVELKSRHRPLALDNM